MIYRNGIGQFRQYIDDLPFIYELSVYKAQCIIDVIIMPGTCIDVSSLQ